MQINYILSIITVVKNDYNRLLKTINSLDNYFKNKNFEYIIIDGKSSDLTFDLIDQLRSKKNIRIISESDNGIYDAMNKGIQIAQGKYLLFLNAGDQMIANSVELCSWLNCIPKNIEICLFPSMMRDENIQIPLIPNISLLHKMPTSHQAMIFLKKFALENLYNIKYKIAGDFDLYLRANKNNLYVFLIPKFLTEIELKGYASANPVLAYMEYLKVAYHRFRGLQKVIVLIKILIKGLFVIIIKKIISKKILSILKNYK